MLVRTHLKAEEGAKSLGETNFKASSGWWEKVRKRNGIGKSVPLHGEAGEVDHEQIKEKIDEIRRDLESYDLENIYNSPFPASSKYVWNVY